MLFVVDHHTFALSIMVSLFSITVYNLTIRAPIKNREAMGDKVNAFTNENRGPMNEKHPSLGSKRPLEWRNVSGEFTLV